MVVTAQPAYIHDPLIRSERFRPTVLVAGDGGSATFERSGIATEVAAGPPDKAEPGAKADAPPADAVAGAGRAPTDRPPPGEATASGPDRPRAARTGRLMSAPR